jgi:hypothetical protein
MNKQLLEVYVVRHLAFKIELQQLARAKEMIEVQNHLKKNEQQNIHNDQAKVKT